jgi:hypothetical protein
MYQRGLYGMPASEIANCGNPPNVISGERGAYIPNSKKAGVRLSI